MFMGSKYPKMISLIRETNRCSKRSRRSLYVYPAQPLHISEAFIAEMSVIPPRKLFIFVVKRTIYRIQVSKQTFDLILKQALLLHILMRFERHR